MKKQQEIEVVIGKYQNITDTLQLSSEKEWKDKLIVHQSNQNQNKFYVGFDFSNEVTCCKLEEEGSHIELERYDYIGEKGFEGESWMLGNSDTIYKVVRKCVKLEELSWRRSILYQVYIGLYAQPTITSPGNTHQGRIEFVVPELIVDFEDMGFKEALNEFIITDKKKWIDSKSKLILSKDKTKLVVLFSIPKSRKRSYAKNKIILIDLKTRKIETTYIFRQKLYFPLSFIETNNKATKLIIGDIYGTNLLFIDLKKREETVLEFSKLNESLKKGFRSNRQIKSMIDEVKSKIDFFGEDRIVITEFSVARQVLSLKIVELIGPKKWEITCYWEADTEGEPDRILISISKRRDMMCVAFDDLSEMKLFKFRDNTIELLWVKRYWLEIDYCSPLFNAQKMFLLSQNRCVLLGNNKLYMVSLKPVTAGQNHSIREDTIVFDDFI